MCVRLYATPRRGPVSSVGVEMKTLPVNNTRPPVPRSRPPPVSFYRYSTGTTMLSLQLGLQGGRLETPLYTSICCNYLIVETLPVERRQNLGSRAHGVARCRTLIRVFAVRAVFRRQVRSDGRPSSGEILVRFSRVAFTNHNGIFQARVWTFTPSPTPDTHRNSRPKREANAPRPQPRPSSK